MNLTNMRNRQFNAPKYTIRQVQDIVGRRQMELLKVVLWTLRIREGYGKIRLERTFKEILEQWGMVDDELITIKDIEDALAEETGLNFN